MRNKAGAWLRVWLALAALALNAGAALACSWVGVAPENLDRVVQYSDLVFYGKVESVEYKDLSEAEKENLQEQLMKAETPEDRKKANQVFMKNIMMSSGKVRVLKSYKGAMKEGEVVELFSSGETTCSYRFTVETEGEGSVFFLKAGADRLYVTFPDVVKNPEKWLLDALDKTGERDSADRRAPEHNFSAQGSEK